MILYIYAIVAVLLFMIGSYFVQKENNFEQSKPNYNKDDPNEHWYGLFIGSIFWPVAVIVGALWLVWFIISAPGRYLANRSKT